MKELKNSEGDSIDYTRGLDLLILIFKNLCLLQSINNKFLPNRD